MLGSCYDSLEECHMMSRWTHFARSVNVRRVLYIFCSIDVSLFVIGIREY